MGTMPMTTPGQQSREPRRDFFSLVLTIAASIFGGGSALYIVVQLIREQPEKAFLLAQTWGPGYLLALFIAFVVNKLLSKAIDGSQSAAERSADAVREVAVEMRSIAEAASRQAAAMQTVADKDDREKQEMQTLVGVVNSKVDQALEEQKRGNRALMRIEDALKINRPEGSDAK